MAVKFQQSKLAGPTELWAYRKQSGVVVAGAVVVERAGHGGGVQGAFS